MKKPEVLKALKRHAVDPKPPKPKSWTSPFWLQP